MIFRATGLLQSAQMQQGDTKYGEPSAPVPEVPETEILGVRPKGLDICYWRFC